MRACRPLKYQIAYGIAGFSCLAAAAWTYMEGYSWAAFGFLAASIIIFRGCPFCWGFDMVDSWKGRKDKAD